MADSRKITIICSRLDLPGGIERATVNTANLFAGNGYSVQLLILDETTSSFYPIDESVKVQQLPLSFGITEKGNVFSRKFRLLRDIRLLGNWIRKNDPEILICTEYPFSAAAVLARRRVKMMVFSWEHHHFYWLKKSAFWSWLIRRTYPKLDAVVCLNESERKIFEKFSPTAVIPNFVPPANRNADIHSKTILSIGTLIPRKGIADLLHTAKIVLNKYPGWTWKLIGDGPLKEQVISFIKKEGLEDRFILQLPVSHDISSQYQNASIFVLTSHFEAFPMVLLEAMSNAVPCASFDCPSGPAEIIEQGISGYLVETGNFDEMARIVSGLILDEGLRRKIGDAALLRSALFSPKNILHRWQQLFEEKNRAIV